MSSAALAIVTLATSVWRWRWMRPSQRLFAMGFLIYSGLSLGISAEVLTSRVDVVPWRAPGILIANVWLIGAVVALWLEWRKDHGPVRQDPPA